MQIELRALELLSSKLCHDLVSPVSAINNGVELIEEIGGDVIPEAMSLVGNSAKQAAHRLRVYRIAYGRAGSDSNLTVHDTRQMIQNYLEKTKITFAWPDSVLDDSFLDHKGAMKTLVNTILLAEETLAYGGTISLAPTYQKGTCRIEVVGRNAQLSDSFKNALEGITPIEEITPRTIQAYMTGRFAAHYQMGVKPDQSVQDRLNFTVSLTPVCV